MGIPNFSSFVSNEGLRKPRQLSDTYVVIDANNLLYYLYNQFIRDNPNDFLFGGNYLQIRIFFERFFDNLKKCRITPIMVFDGGLNLQLEKSRRIRFEKAFKASQELYIDPPKTNGCVSSAVYPYLLQDVIISVIKEKNVICFTTVFDADLNVAKLANDLKCPVISNDSDFLIMAVDDGVINCDFLQWQKPIEFRRRVPHIECLVYRVSHFVDRFKLKPEMLPVFASLMGNDSIDNKIFEALFNHISFVLRFSSLAIDKKSHSNHFNGSYEKTNDRWLRMSQLIDWLKTHFFTAKQAIAYIERFLENNGIGAKDFRASVESYSTDGKCYLKDLLSYKLSQTKEDDIPIDKIVGQNRFPKWFLMSYFYRTELDTSLFTYIDSKVCHLRPLIEDFRYKSCFESSYDLMASLLGLLRLKPNDMTPIRVITRRHHQVMEYEWRPLTHIRHTSTGDRQIPILTQLDQLSKNDRKQLIFDILKFEEKRITCLEDDLTLIKLDMEDIKFWQYFVVVIKYMITNSELKELPLWRRPTRSNVQSYYAIFVRSIVLSVIHHRHYSLTKGEFSELLSVPKQQFQPIITHFYGEFGVVYKTIDTLNSLLGYPITDVQLHRCLNGVLYYNIFDALDGGRLLSFRVFKERRLNFIDTSIMSAIS